MVQIGVQLALDLSREPRVTVRAQLGFCIQRYGQGSSSPCCCEGGCYLCFRGVEIRTLRGGLRITSTSVFSQASGMSSEPAPSASQQSSASPPSPGSLHLPENRRARDRSPSPMRGYLIPSPLPTRRTRTFSATVRASEGPIYKGVCKCFCRSKGHGFITPADGGADIFVHISDIEGEYVPVAGDEVTYKMCTIPPKNEKLQAVEVVITHLAPGTKHETWSGHVVSS
ncbi:calcium-regulated heat-stable protein 1 isoform X1 [Columba livia]